MRYKATGRMIKIISDLKEDAMTTTEKTRNTNSKKKDFKKLGFSALDTIEITQGLNQLLANYSVHYQKLRNFHWNVKGNDFFRLHEKFEELYDEARGHIDDIAERIRVFGQMPMSTMGEYIENAEIKEIRKELPAREMVVEVLLDIRILLSDMHSVVHTAQESDDTGTEDMLTSYIQGLEKHHWMLSAWLNEKWEVK